MIINLNTISTKNIIEEVISGLENWCRTFNKFILIFFIFLKFIFVFILLFIGIFTLLKLRGIYFQTRIKDIGKTEDRLKIPRLVLGWCYIFLAIGILFNYLTYFLIFCLDPLPDRLIFNFLDFSENIDARSIKRVEDIDTAKYDHEKTIFYCFALLSFEAVLHLILSIWYLINNNKILNNPRIIIGNLIYSLTAAMLFGFTTFLPFFL